ncbi:hypothetical protein AVEN_36647-1 [Araneus ventricosus]|uniref:Uncharacterized protein n=1 Tax=Araneus ventricosus TaxID=182803 RepID=A0A4Y2FWA7_ARAVE|nr:hypothetical protein AVEN_36647-1 [Araneus ventricosus]
MRTHEERIFLVVIGQTKKIGNFTARTKLFEDFWSLPFRKGSSQGSDEPGRREVERPVLPVDRQQPDSGEDARPKCSGQQLLLKHHGVRCRGGQQIQVRFRPSALPEI